MSMKTLLTTAVAGVIALSGCGQGNLNDSSNGATQSQNQEQQDASNQIEKSNKAKNNQEERLVSAAETDQSSSNKNETSDTFDKERARVVLTEFEKAFKKVINYTDDQQRLKAFDTKQELINHFKHFMSKDLAQSMVNAYFKEKEDGVYVVAMDAPTFLKEDQPFTFSKTGPDKAKVVQERRNELIGHVNMEFILTKKDNRWIVKTVNREQLNE